MCSRRFTADGRMGNGRIGGSGDLLRSLRWCEWCGGSSFVGIDAVCRGRFMADGVFGSDRVGWAGGLLRGLGRGEWGELFRVKKPDVKGATERAKDSRVEVGEVPEADVVETVQVFGCCGGFDGKENFGDSKR